MTTLKEVIREHGFEVTLRKVMQQCEPETQEEAVSMIKTLATGLTMTMAWECERHIADHDGYGCARHLIEAIGEDVKEEAHDHLNQLLEMLDKPLLDKSDHNEKVAAEILKEMDDD